MDVSLPNISPILEDINAKGKSVTNDTSNDNARKALLKSARSLVTALETPFEVVARMNWNDVSPVLRNRSTCNLHWVLFDIFIRPPKWAMTRIGYDLNLFEKMLENNGSPKSCEELGQLTGADPKLLCTACKSSYIC